MAKLTDLYAQLKSSIIGTKTQKTDAALDKAVNDIIGYKSNSGRNGYIDLVRTVIAKSTTGMGFGGGNSLYSQSQTGPAGFGQGMRLMRYKTYEAIVYNISYAYRALSVLVDNILSPDDITKISLDVKPKSYIESESTDESNVKRVKDIISGIKLEERLPLIVRGSLLYGDFFCEIAPPKIALTSKSIINESGGYNDYINNQIKLGIKQSWTEKFNINRKEVNFKVFIDYSSFMESTDEKKVDKNNKIYNLTLVLHKPNRVVKLQSSLFPVCFGYLVFPDMTALSVGSGALEDQPVNNLCMNILRNLKDKIPQMAEFQNNKELKDLIKYMIKQTDPSQALEIRYVPPDKMTHFHPPSSKYYPYGESIFDSSQYLAKVLIALETALAVQRLSRSTEKRKIAIEVGLPRDARKAIENMKEEFRKRKVSLDSFGTVDTIPCLALDTKISMANGFSMKLEDIIDQFTNGNRNMFVYSYDFNTGKVFPNRIVNAKISGRNVDVIKITLDNGKFEYCTSDHRWMLRNGQYKKAEDLQPGDSLMPFYKDNPEKQSIMNHKVVKVEKCSIKMDVGDIEVEKFHNFGLESGVFIHNSMITTFEDVYIPQKDGKPFVDISTFNEGSVDVRSKTDELKFMRDSLTATWNVPPSFLGIEENLSNKNALSEENILFARAVIGHQKYLSHQLSDLVKKVFDIIDPESSMMFFDNIDLHLPTPKSLQFERESRYMNELVGLIESLDRIGIPKEFSKRKYLTNFDWVEIKKYSIDQKVEQSLDPSKKDDDLMNQGVGGGFGGTNF